VPVLGYFVDNGGDKTSSWDVFVAIVSEDGEYLGHYCPQTGHGDLQKGYLETCQRITKEEYLEASKLFYTPKDYLEDIKCHRCGDKQTEEFSLDPDYRVTCVNCETETY
jgi:ribosomal protein S27E